MRTVSGAVLGCEFVAVVLGWEAGFTGRVKGHSERGHVRLNQDIGGNDFGLELRMGAHKARVLMTSHIEPGPTVEAAFLHRRHIVRNEIVAQSVTLVSGAPELTRDSVDRLADAVAT